MGRLAVILAAVSLAVAVALPAAAARRPVFTGHTKRQAEVNILHATGVLRRWHVPVLNRRTNTIKSNTRVSCAGAMRPVAQRFKAFICTISYRQVRVRLWYTAFTGNGFGVRRLPLHPKAR